MADDAVLCYVLIREHWDNRLTAEQPVTPKTVGHGRSHAELNTDICRCIAMETYMDLCQIHLQARMKVLKEIVIHSINTFQDTTAHVVFPQPAGVSVQRPPHC